MNVLLYVMTIIMLLTALTYAKLNSFRMLLTTELGFSRYMQSSEIEPINQMNVDLYDLIKIKKIKGTQSNNERIAGTSRLSLFPLINQEAREKDPEIYRETAELLKQLMSNLFKDNKTIQEALKKRPNLFNDIVDEIQRASIEVEGKKLTNAACLAKLEFTDKELHYYFYLMLTGQPSEAIKQPEIPAQTTSFEIVNLDKTDQDDEDDVVDETEESASKPGYVSLQDYITLKKGSKIRVYLASFMLLKSIYGTDEMALAVIEARENIFKQIKANPSIKDEAAKQFQENFQSIGNALNYKDLLNFSVSGTDPKKYNRK